MFLHALFVLTLSDFDTVTDLIFMFSTFPASVGLFCCNQGMSTMSSATMRLTRSRVVTWPINCTLRALTANIVDGHSCKVHS